ncbi:MAG: hypothetical protein JWO35_377 [Candidatus Saccharibacteria bacterium]|nr:hypothetical protein [Candidatus Saccharibacteria bacterium]
MQTATTAFVLCGLVVAGRPILVQADTAATPSLVVSQLKITSSEGQFVTLFNTTNTTLDMSKYQLEYFNNSDLSKATSSRLIALSGIVPPHSYYMVNDSALLLCYKLTINSVSLGFSSTAGLVQVLALQQSSPGGAVGSILQDYVGWSKTAAAGAQTLPSNTSAFLQRQPLDAANNPLVTSAGSGSWLQVQRSSSDPCSLVTGSAAPVPVQTGLSLLLPSSEPPATIVSLGDLESEASVATPTGVLPASDIGLMAPQVTELLPNPDGTGNDATDEYIELFNPNSVSFDLTGFALQSGVTSLRSYVFPTGTILPPKAFVAFYAETTNLSLSNTSGQVKLLDPFGNAIATTNAYASAKDGQSWALANGKWYWSTSPTAGTANVIKQPVSKKAKTASAKSKTTSSAAKVKGAKTSKPVKTTALAGSIHEEPTKTPIHPRVLALIAGLALLYGAYEYRADMANRIYQFRRYLSARRANRG